MASITGPVEESHALIRQVRSQNTRVLLFLIGLLSVPYCCREGQGERQTEEWRKVQGARYKERDRGRVKETEGGSRREAERGSRRETEGVTRREAERGSRRETERGVEGGRKEG